MEGRVVRLDKASCDWSTMSLLRRDNGDGLIDACGGIETRPFNPGEDEKDDPEIWGDIFRETEGY